MWKVRGEMLGTVSTAYSVEVPASSELGLSSVGNSVVCERECGPTQLHMADWLFITFSLLVASQDARLVCRGNRLEAGGEWWFDRTRPKFLMEANEKVRNLYLGRGFASEVHVVGSFRH